MVRKIGLTGKELNEVRTEIGHRIYQARQNHGAGRAVQKAYEDKAEGLVEADNLLYQKLRPKIEKRMRV